MQTLLHRLVSKRSAANSCSKALIDDPTQDGVALLLCPLLPNTWRLGQIHTIVFLASASLQACKPAALQYTFQRFTETSLPFSTHLPSKIAPLCQLAVLCCCWCWGGGANCCAWWCSPQPPPPPPPHATAHIASHHAAAAAAAAGARGVQSVPSATGLLPSVRGRPCLWAAATSTRQRPDPCSGGGL